MDILETFLSKIATLFPGKDQQDLFDQNGSIVTGSKTIEFINLFFDESDGQGIKPLVDYLSNFEQIPDGNLAMNHKTDSGLNCTVVPLRSANEKIEHGLFDISDCNGNEAGFIFTGEFSGSSSQPELKKYKGLILAVCLLNPMDQESTIQTFTKIFEAFGPLAVIFTTNKIPFAHFAESGFFIRNNKRFEFSWKETVGEITESLKVNIPPEAEQAYIMALSSSSSPEVAFTQLYRVFEILFAARLKEKIESCDVREIIKTMNDFKANELHMLMVLLENSTRCFNWFTKNDFMALYTDAEVNDKYAGIRTWINSKSNKITDNPPDNLSYAFIYYIRCSLVHSKLSKNERFLLGPFNDDQNEALAHLVEDVRHIIKSLIY